MFVAGVLVGFVGLGSAFIEGAAEVEGAEEGEEEEDCFAWNFASFAAFFAGFSGFIFLRCVCG